MDGKLVRCHVRLYEKDVAKIKLRFGDTVGFNEAVRNMVHQYMSQIDRIAEEKLRGENIASIAKGLQI